MTVNMVIDHFNGAYPLWWGHCPEPRHSQKTQWYPPQNAPQKWTRPMSGYITARIRDIDKRECFHEKQRLMLFNLVPMVWLGMCGRMLVSMLVEAKNLKWPPSRCGTQNDRGNEIHTMRFIKVSRNCSHSINMLFCKKKSIGERWTMHWRPRCARPSVHVKVLRTQNTIVHTL